MSCTPCFKHLFGKQRELQHEEMQMGISVVSCAGSPSVQSGCIEGLKACNECLMCIDRAGKELAPVWDNSIAWGGFMATSANLRYQLVNGIEDRLLVWC